jgi:hypothetical protein
MWRPLRGLRGVVLASVLAFSMGTQLTQLSEASAASAQPAAPDLRATLSRLDGLYRYNNSRMEGRLYMIGAKATRSVFLEWLFDEYDKTMITVTAPEKVAGTRILRDGSSVWTYSPSLVRAIQIPVARLQELWLDSDFSYDAMTGVTSYANDYTATLKGYDAARKGWWLELSARPEVTAAWKRMELLVDQAGSLPIEARCYDHSNLLNRTFTYSDLRQVGGRMIPTTITVTPNSRKVTHSTIKIDKLVGNVMTAPEVFTLGGLQRGLPPATKGSSKR